MFYLHVCPRINYNLLTDRTLQYPFPRSLPTFSQSTPANVHDQLTLESRLELALIIIHLFAMKICYNFSIQHDGQLPFCVYLPSLFISSIDGGGSPGPHHMCVVLGSHLMCPVGILKEIGS